MKGALPLAMKFNGIMVTKDDRIKSLSTNLQSCFAKTSIVSNTWDEYLSQLSTVDLRKKLYRQPFQNLAFL